jgi:hypothetical protein
VGPHLAQPDLHRSGLRVLLVEQADEPLRLGWVDPLAAWRRCRLLTSGANI